ncbi:hypothetical protein I6J39_00160 [Streptomyces californicus]|uniref:Uncharacterized protein n=1 Tax=Streptomyces californicus TaxID=67351 RepID=A0ABX7JCV2_9ACTN|nr:MULTISPECIES: hypothetical protein [Streptomyces]QRV25867.1 hypothetical protein I6J39_00160 [Streptomyces californicus]QRV46003.1 hypothetical protein I6J41_35030 [Streptomyces californicus]
MSKFPSGPFTIVNQETGRCLRVRLGETVDLSSHRLGTEYLLSQSYPPSLELGPADGSKATAWYYRSHDDALERQPFNQIASSAVSDLQNIGDYGVWMYSEPFAEERENALLRAWYASKLNDATGEVAKRLQALIPEEWHVQVSQEYEDELADWEKAGSQFEGVVDEPNGRQAALLEELRPQHGKLLEALPGHMDAIMKAYLNAPKLHWKHKDGTALDKQEMEQSWERALLIGAKAVQSFEEQMEHAEPQELESLLGAQVLAMRFSGAEKISERLGKLGLPSLFGEALEEARRTEQALVKALKAEAPVRAWQRRAPIKGVARWNDRCASLAFYGEDGLDVIGEKFVEAMRAYLDAAAKEGITKPVSTASSRTGMYGCGAKRYEGSTYRWDYDGTYITASDSKTVPSERTYWTDDDGRLVGKTKGGPGQKWTVTPYKEPADKVNGEDIFLTGLFGPLASILRPA